jgi:hypothetical protein
MPDSVWEKVGKAVAAAAGIATVVGTAVVLLEPPPKDCEENVYEVIVDADACGLKDEPYVIAPPVARSCRLKEFGFVRWQKERTFEYQSEWMSTNPGFGGCDDFFYEGKGLPISIGEHFATEDRHQNNEVGDGGTRFRYSCSGKFLWEPLYNEKQDEACGMTEPVMGVKQVPASCSRLKGRRKVECDGV